MRYSLQWRCCFGMQQEAKQARAGIMASAMVVFMLDMAAYLSWCTALTSLACVSGRNFFTDAFRSKSFGGPPPIVTGLALTADGLLSCGLDGNVKVHPFL